MTRSLVVLASALALLLLSACPQLGVVCKEGTIRCGNGCADPTSDAKNCGSCGIACGADQVCSASTCACRAGTTDCAGTCAVTASDAKNCGSCGHACASGEVCEAGECKGGCALGTSLKCGASCVDAATDPSHCGDCTTVCGAGQSCHAGKCAWDVVLACFTSGQVAGLQAGSELRGPLSDLGSGPAALALAGNVLLAADGTDARLVQASFPALTSLGRSNTTGQVPNQVVVDGTTVYVINSQSGTLQVLQPGDGGVVEDGGTQGLALATVAELPLGANTWPEGIAKLGTDLWIPLYGGFGGAAAAAGQKVVKVSVADPKNPTVADTVDLASVNLLPFDGGTSVARPWAIVTHKGALYVALNNLDPDTYAPSGPGLLARIDPTTKAVTTVNLGADACLNPQWLASDGTRLVVSCGGAPQYDSSYAVVSTDKAGLVLVDSSDARAGTWSAACPASAALPDGGTTCRPVMPGRFALRDGRVYLGDQNAGRLFVLDVTDAGFTERRGYASDAGLPVQACPVSAISGKGNVSDVLAVP